jgi:hypothetical protein
VAAGVRTADICWLEYGDQEFFLAEEIPQGGLYSVKLHGSVCLLPLSDGHQTMQVIAAIERKLPGLSEAWRNHSHIASAPNSWLSGNFSRLRGH